MSVRSAHFQAGRLGRADQGTRLARVLAAGMAHTTTDTNVKADDLKAQVDYAAAKVKLVEDANDGAGNASWEEDEKDYEQKKTNGDADKTEAQKQEVIDQNTPISKPIKELTKQEKRAQEADQAQNRHDLAKRIQNNRRKSMHDGSDIEESDDESQASPRAQTPSRRSDAQAKLEAFLANRSSEPRPQAPAPTTPVAPVPAPTTPPPPSPPPPAPAPATKPSPPPNKPKPALPRPPNPGEPGPPPRPQATAPATAPEPELPKTPSLKTLGNVVLAANELRQTTPPPTPPTPQPQPAPAPAPASATERVTWTLMTDPNLSAANLRLRQLMVELMAA